VRRIGRVIFYWKEEDSDAKNKGAKCYSSLKWKYHLEVSLARAFR